MRLRFTNLREPVAVDALSPLQRRQLRAAGKLYDGKDLPAAQRFSAGLPEDADDDEVESCFGGYLELWDVLDDAGVHRHDAYLYAVDSGTVFRRGTTDVVAEMIQFYFQANKDPALAEALQSAHRSADKALQQARKAAKKTAAKKTAAKKTAAKKTAAKKTAAKSVTKKTAAKKTTAKSVAKKTTAKKPAAKKTTAKKSAAKKTAKKTAAKKTAAKKTAAKKTTAKSVASKSTATNKPAASKRAR